MWLEILKKYQNLPQMLKIFKNHMQFKRKTTIGRINAMRGGLTETTLWPNCRIQPVNIRVNCVFRIHVEAQLCSVLELMRNHETREIMKGF